MQRILGKADVVYEIECAKSRGYDPLFDNVDLSGLDLSGMNFSGARFICSKVDGTKFVGCWLEQSRWCLTDVSTADISCATITTSILEGKPTFEQLTDTLFPEQLYHALLHVKLGTVVDHAGYLRVQNIIRQHNTFKNALPQCAHWIVP